MLVEALEAVWAVMLVMKFKLEDMFKLYYMLEVELVPVMEEVSAKMSNME